MLGGINLRKMHAYLVNYINRLTALIYIVGDFLDICGSSVFVLILIIYAVHLTH